MTVKRLGKLPKKVDPRTLQLSRYMDSRKLPTPPVKIDHSSRLPSKIGMMGNDKYGDCAIAAPGHMVQSWTTYADFPMKTIPDADILKSYFTLSPNDQGCNMLDVMNYWRKTGIGSDKCEAFVETGIANVTQAKLAIQYFGSLYIGMSLPNTNTFGPWSVKTPTWPAQRNNGHAVALLAYDDSKEMFRVATWGEVWDMSYGWFKKYCDESYAVLNDVSLNATGLSPEGFNLAALQFDLAHLGDPVTPPAPTPVPVPPVPVPPPPPPPTPDPDVFTPDGPLTITGTNGGWVVAMDNIAQLPAHNSAFEAVQHADKIRWEFPHAKITISHSSVYQVE